MLAVIHQGKGIALQRARALSFHFTESGMVCTVVFRCEKPNSQGGNHEEIVV